MLSTSDRCFDFVPTKGEGYQQDKLCGCVVLATIRARTHYFLWIFPWRGNNEGELAFRAKKILLQAGPVKNGRIFYAHFLWV